MFVHHEALGSINPKRRVHAEPAAISEAAALFFATRTSRETSTGSPPNAARTRNKPLGGRDQAEPARESHPPGPRRRNAKLLRITSSINRRDIIRHKYILTIGPGIPCCSKHSNTLRCSVTGYGGTGIDLFHCHFLPQTRDYSRVRQFRLAHNQTN